MTLPDGPKILSGDIGGTHTRLAVMTPRPDGGFDHSHRVTLKSSEYPTFLDVVRAFRESEGSECTVASFGIAGPVLHRRCRVTNLPWEVDAAEVESVLGFERVELINDLEAQAHGVAVLGQDNLLTLRAGEPMPGNAALIAAGTGLGEAGLYFQKEDRRQGDGQRQAERLLPFATEGGHCDFAPRNEREIELLRFLRHRLRHRHAGRVSWERVLSGPGLQNLFDFVVEVEGVEPSGRMVERLANEADVPAAIAECALSEECPAADRTLDFFVELYGSEAGNLALKVMARAGVFLGGGIAPKILERLRSPLFLEAFDAKGRMHKVLEKIPIVVILEGSTALLGAARHAMQVVSDRSMGRVGSALGGPAEKLARPG